MPQIRDGRSVFCPPASIARDEPYCLFLDELNAATPDVQKAFYSLILDRRIGLQLPKGSVVIGAGNRATDNALARPLASALVNRLTHVHLTASPKDWLVWAANNGMHRSIADHPHRPPRPPVVQTAEDRGAVLHAPLLAHALRRAALLAATSTRTP
ncbi:hypothetical protein STENM223S_04235 [Streptomyces tendae]